LGEPSSARRVSSEQSSPSANRQSSCGGSSAATRRRMKAAKLSAATRHRGTEGSNPFPSSRESRANLYWSAAAGGRRLGCGPQRSPCDLSDGDSPRHQGPMSTHAWIEERSIRRQDCRGHDELRNSLRCRSPMRRLWGHLPDRICGAPRGVKHNC
jgi:hypothetical protein